MPSITIALSLAQEEFVNAHVKRGGFESAGEYVAFLVSLEQLKKRSDKIDALLLEGIRGRTTPMTDKDWEEIEKEGMKRLAADKKNVSNHPKRQRSARRLA